MINVEVATILHFTQVIYQITRHSVLSDIYIWNIVSWQLEHIHSRLNTCHLMGKVDYNNHYSIICLFVWFCFCLFFLRLCLFCFLFFLICLLFMRRLPLCVIQLKSVSNDLRIHWIPSSLVNFLDMINIMYFLSRVLGFHPKIAFVFIRIPSVSFYMDTIHFFSFGYHFTTYQVLKVS